MKKLFSLLTTFAIVLSCSSDETSAPIQYTLTVTASEGGSVTDGGTFDDGTEVTITATANEFYTFSGWEGNDSNEIALEFKLILI